MRQLERWQAWAEQRRSIEPPAQGVIRNAIEALYDRLAWLYDPVGAVIYGGLWRRWRRCALAFIKGPRVLEIGAGTGDLLIALQSRGYDVWGIDRSPRMLREARRKLGTTSGAHLYTARAQQLPFASGSFDTVVSTFGSDYIIDERTHREIARVLVPGGRVVIIPGGSRIRGTARARSGGPMRLERVPDESHPGEGWVAEIMRLSALADVPLSLSLASDGTSRAIVLVGEKAGR